MDSVILQEYKDAGEDANDIILYLQRHGPFAISQGYHGLYGSTVLSNYAMRRAAKEIWREFDLERYQRERNEWMKDTPYAVLRRMFWGRYRRYWNPSRQSGDVWLYYIAKKKEHLDNKRAEDRQDRHRGAEKRRVKEQQQIERIGLEGFNRRMERQKAESIQIKAAKVNRTSKEFLRFLDWRQGSEGKIYDTTQIYVTPRQAFCTPSGTSDLPISVPMRKAHDLYEVLCRIVAKPVCSVEITLMQTAAIETVPVPYLLVGDGLARLNGMSRLSDFVTKRLHSHVENDGKHYFGWGEIVRPYRQFPDEWRQYEGLELPFGNPQKSARGEIVRRLLGCIVKMTITTPDHKLVFHTGAETFYMTPADVITGYFQDPFERERQKTLKAQQDRIQKRRNPTNPTVYERKHAN